MAPDRTSVSERNLGLLEVLTPEQVLQVDQALAAIGPFGEVRLVKVRGRLRFIQQLESHDLLREGGSLGVE